MDGLLQSVIYIPETTERKDEIRKLNFQYYIIFAIRTLQNYHDYCLSINAFFK